MDIHDSQLLKKRIFMYILGVAAKAEAGSETETETKDTVFQLLCYISGWLVCIGLIFYKAG